MSPRRWAPPCPTPGSSSSAGRGKQARAPWPASLRVAAGPSDVISTALRTALRLGDDFLAGFVLYTGTATLPFGDKLRAVPASALWQVSAPAPAEDVG